MRGGIRISAELLRDQIVTLQIVTPEQWAAHVETLRAERKAMDLDKATPAAKGRLTRQIRRAEAVKPTRPFLRFMPS